MSKTITDALHHIGSGSLIEDANDKMTELVRAVDETGRTGKIELTINVKKTTRGGAMHLTGKVKLTRPDGDPMEAMLFATEHGELTPDNPIQQCMDLRVIEQDQGKKENLKEINK